MHILKWWLVLACCACGSPHGMNSGGGSSAMVSAESAAESGQSSSTSNDAPNSSSGEGTTVNDPLCDTNANEVTARFELIMPDDDVQGTPAGLDVSLASDNCTVNLITSDQIDFQCTYADPPLLRNYFLGLTIDSPVSKLPFEVGSVIALRAHILVLPEVARFSWVRIENDSSSRVVALELAELWEDEALPTIVAEAFGDLARETEAQFCPTAVAKGQSTRTEESMEFQADGGWIEVRHDSYVVLKESPPTAAWLGEAHYVARNDDPEGRYRNREVVLLTGFE